MKGEGNQQDYGMRIYDGRLGRFLSVDPLTPKYPELTPYQFASNRPIDGIDLDGLEWFGTPGGQANQIYISNLATPKTKQVSGEQLAASMAAHSRTQIYIGRKTIPVIVIGMIGFTNPVVGIPLALSYLTGAPVLPAPQAMGGVGASGIVSQNSAEESLVVAESAATANRPVVVSDKHYAQLKELEVTASNDELVGTVSSSRGNLDFYIKTAETEYAGRGGEVFKALYKNIASRETVTGINGTWSRGSLGSNLRAFNSAIQKRLAS